MKNLFLILFFCSIVLLPSCVQDDTSIFAIIENDKKGNCILKWEVYPDRDEAMMEIYASSNDSVFPQTPIKTVNVNKFIDIIENADSLGYKYFKLKVGSTFSPIIAKKFYRFDNIQNFRDIGGYTTNDGKTVKWGKIFRSGDFSNVSEKDQKILSALNINTIIDMRSKETQNNFKDIISTPHRYELYISGTYNDSISEKVLENRFLKGDALIYMQDAYEAILMQHTEQYAKFFDYLTQTENYPIAYHCSLGKDQTGIATFFLLRALDVPVEVAEDDFMYSNRGVNRQKIIEDASELTETQQQIFTMLTNTDVSYLRYALACARKESGSLDNFMTDKLKLTQDKRKKLRNILLYEK